jgi:hypothetical protein
VGVSVLATFTQLIKPAAGLTLAGAALSGLVFLMFRHRAISWGACAAVAFLVLFCGVWQLQPAYNRQYAIRSDLRALVEQVDSEHLSVICYPQRYDSASFYLPRADIYVYSADQRRQMFDDLRARPETLVLVKSGRSLRELTEELPEALEFVTRNRQNAVVVGWVRVREPGGSQVAKR